MHVRSLQLHHATPPDTQWLRAALQQSSRSFGALVDQRPDGLLALRLGAS